MNTYAVIQNITLSNLSVLGGAYQSLFFSSVMNCRRSHSFSNESAFRAFKTLLVNPWDDYGNTTVTLSNIYSSVNVSVTATVQCEEKDCLAVLTPLKV